MLESQPIDTSPEPPKQGPEPKPEPSKRNLIAWIWSKLADPPPGGDSEPIFHATGNDSSWS